jgi:hypothetical protein
MTPWQLLGNGSRATGRGRDDYPLRRQNMSYWSHNPEVYQEICNKAIVRKLVANMPYEDYFFTEEQVKSMLSSALDELSIDKEFSKAYDALLDWAQKEVSDGEANYFADLGELSDRCDRSGGADGHVD